MTRQNNKAMWAIGLVSVLLGLLWLRLHGPWRSPSAPLPQSHEASTAQLRGLSGSVGSGPFASGEAPAEAVEKLPMPPCWEGLLALDERPSLLSLRDALRAAISGEDPLLIDYLQERLAEVIGGDPASALTVVGWATESGPPLSSHLLTAVKHTAAVQQKAVADKLLALGADGKQGLDVRRAALDALETQRTLPPDALGQLKSVAMDQDADEVAWMATRTIGKVMTEEFGRGGSVGSYMKELLDIGQHSADTAVRSLALEMPSYANIPVDKSALAQLGQALARDPDRAVREMAAFRLGLSRDPGEALSHLGGAFAGERDLCVRAAIFRFAVRAAGSKALPLLDKLSKIEPRLRPDYEDYAAIYARGTVDFARVWLEKPERIQCLDEGE